MPGVTSAAALLQAAADVPADALLLTAEPEALDAARRSLDSSGLLLLGEVHGVRENPMLAHALLDPLGVTSLALEWPEELAPVVDGFLATGMLDDHPLLWAGDGRITAGQLAMLAGRIPAGRLRLILFDVSADAYWSWSQQDEAMVRRLLAASPSDAPTLARRTWRSSAASSS